MSLSFLFRQESCLQCFRLKGGNLCDFRVRWHIRSGKDFVGTSFCQRMVSQNDSFHGHVDGPFMRVMPRIFSILGGYR